MSSKAAKNIYQLELNYPVHSANDFKVYYLCMCVSRWLGKWDHLLHPNNRLWQSNLKRKKKRKKAIRLFSSHLCNEVLISTYVHLCVTTKCHRYEISRHLPHSKYNISSRIMQIWFSFVYFYQCTSYVLLFLNYICHMPFIWIISYM